MKSGRRWWFTQLPIGLLAAPLIAEAQPARVARIGFISVASASAMTARDQAFKDALRELGYVEGQTLAIDYRWANGREEQLPDLAAELVRLKPDVIVTHGVVATRAVRQATSRIPIVIAAAGDPLVTGLVSNLARPGGNITGLTVIAPETTGKRLELLRELVPRLTRVAVLWNASNPISEPELKETEAAARALGMPLHSVGVRGADELASAFASMARERVLAVLVLSDAMFFGRRKQIVDLGLAHRLPVVSHLREFADSGGVLTYGPNVVDLHRRAAVYVDKILRGANPGDLPIERPAKFDLAINMRTAKALGLTVPQSLLLRAEHVIE